MGKIKLNLVSGTVVEKPLISAFKASNNNYVILDNEMNGSMGLPIILVCKLENEKLIKIVDQNEWQLVKEYLKNIIAGNSVEYFKLKEEISADDIYYTQLTLPVPSFDALKNAYKVEEELPISNELNFDPQPININDVPSTPVIETPVNPVMPDVTIAPNDVVGTVTPVMPEINTEPAIDIPIAPVMPEVPTVQATPVNAQVVTEPEITPTPIINTEVPVNNTIDLFKEQKETFMQACENMFDALVQKFEKELENRK